MGSKDLRSRVTASGARESKYLLNHTKRLRREKQTISKRALFYLYPGLFETQAIIDYAMGNCPFIQYQDDQYASIMLQNYDKSEADLFAF